MPTMAPTTQSKITLPKIVRDYVSVIAGSNALMERQMRQIWGGQVANLSINSFHLPTKLLQPANLTTYTILSLFSLHVEPAPHLLSP